MDPRTLTFLAVAFLAGMAVLVMMLRNPSAAIMALGLGMFFSALAAQDSSGRYVNATWLRPLQLARAELYLAAGLLMLLGVLVHVGRMQFRHINFQGMVLLSINFFAGMLEMHHRTPLEGLQRIFFSLATIGPVMVMMPSLFALDAGNIMRSIRAAGLVGVVWTGCTLVQVVIDRNQLVLQDSSRFTGLLGNPQGTAVFLGPMCGILAYLMMNETHRRLRLVWIGTLGIMMLFIVWSGSRTGSLMFLFALMGALYSRAGRAIFLLPVFAGAALGLVQLLEALGVDLGYGFKRLTSGTDTRTEIWLVLLEDAINTPLLGFGDGRKGGVENAYLLGWVIYGPLMLLLLVFYLFYSIFFCFRLLTIRSRLTKSERALADFIIAFNAMYFAGAFFEWFIMSRVDSTHLLIVVFGAAGEYLIRTARERALGVWGETDQVAYDEFSDDRAPA
jgi:hypothetical protein